MERLKPSTIERELRRVESGMRDAVTGSDAENWLYGAAVALSWVLRKDTMRPSRAFIPTEAK